MKSIVSEGLGVKKIKAQNIFKTSLALTLIVFAFTMSSPSSYFQIIKPAEAAGTLTSIAVLPTNNIVNTRTTYDIIFKTATTGTIKTIHMTFPVGFDVSAATRVIEKSGIGSGSLSVSCSISSCDLKYTVSNPVSVPAGTTIRLEIARIVNSDTEGSFKISVSTEAQVIIDGPTQSPSFPIKAITGNDISSNFILRKTLNDDAAGHAHGWNPDGVTTLFQITDDDFQGVALEDFFPSIALSKGGQAICAVLDFFPGSQFTIKCTAAPPADVASLHYELHSLPGQIVPSSLSVSSSSQSNSTNNLESVREHDQIASEFP